MAQFYRAKRLLAATLLVLNAGVPLRGFAQDQPTTRPVAPEGDWRREMEDRMQRLEQENTELRERLGKVADTQQAVMKDAQERGLLSLEGGQPRLTTPDFFDVNKYAAEGDFPGSFRIPGSKMSLQIGGFVQLDTLIDNHNIGNTDSFVVNTIPTGGADTGSGNTNFSVRQTRLFLKTSTPTVDWGNLITYVEIDFFGTDGAEPRIRHAYGQFGDKYQFLAGQTWSAFQDATVLPAVLDFAGPAGVVTSRRPQIRARQEWNKQWATVISLEDPASELTTPTTVAGEDSTPYADLDGNVRWTPDWGHVQLSGVLRYLQFNPDAGGRESTWGYGLNLTGSIKTFRVDDKHVDLILYQATAGSGIARYINDTGGLQLDGVVEAPGASLDSLDAFGGMIVYQHWWSAKWASSAGYSIVLIDNSDGEAGTDYHSGQYAVANLRFYPADRVLLGGEILYGIREDNDGSTGDDIRLQFSAQFRF